MPKEFYSAIVTLAAAVATAGTFTVGYPTGTNKGSFLRGTAHVMVALGTVFRSPTDFTVAYGASSATITYNGATTLPAGTVVAVQLDRGGPASYREGPEYGVPSRVEATQVFTVNLGNPAVNDADGLITSAAVTSAAPVLAGSFTGALADASGNITLDVPRNIVAAWTTTAVMTVTGTDEYGEALVESSASGATMTGKKAFKTVTSVAVSANVTGCTVGIGNVLGLPVRLPNAANILQEMEDGAAPTAGTTVAALAQGTKSTATTADVRGTYVPNSTPDGSKTFALVVAVPDINDLGNPQYSV